jgi:hypothetical protein
VQQVFRFGVLDQETPGPGPQGGVDVLVEAVVGQHDHVYAGQPRVGGDLPGRLDAVQDRHLDVDQRDVGQVRHGERDRLTAVRGLGYHLDVVLGVQQRPEAGPDQGLIIGEQYPDHESTPNGSSARTRNPPP